MTPTTLVTGANAGAREAAIAAALRPGVASAVILEGLADGGAALACYDGAPAPQPLPNILRIAPGCLCCAGNLVLRVTLNRLLRQPPDQLYIALADARHLEQLRAMLTAAPYDRLLRIGPDLAA